MSEKFSVMPNSGDLNGSPDSVRQNVEKLPLKQLAYRAKQNKKQQELYNEIDEDDHQKADSELENALLSLDVFADGGELRKAQNRDLDVNDKLNIQQKIKNYTESLKGEKSHQEILRLLIAKFENEKGVETLVNNFRNYLKLYQFAETKPPQERKAIQRIISKADFSNESAFSNSLAQISQSAEISKETKFEVVKVFSGVDIYSVDGMDYQLEQVKEHTKAIQREIDNKSRKQESLDSEIEDLENELSNLSLGSPKRQELEEKIEQKKEQLENTKDEIKRLEKGKPKETSFVLREGFLAKLNPDGSRSIKIGENFAIKLPSNRLPFFSGDKNMRTINLVFPFKTLRDLQIADVIFSPNMENNTVPTKSQRDMGYLILSSLGINDTKILSEENIKKLKKDLQFLKHKGGKSPKEYLIELGIYDVGSQSLDREEFKKRLELIKDNNIVR